MKTYEPLNIPPAILGLADVTASEKMLLALYAAEPETKNFRALQVLGVGLSGLKKIKKRLIVKGLLRCKGSGYEVLVPGLAPEPESAGGALFPKIGSSEKGEEVAPPTWSIRKVATAVEIIDTFMTTWELALDMKAHVSTLHHILQSALDQIMDLPDEHERNLLVPEFTARRDAFFALSYASEHLPRQYLRQVDRLVARSTPEQLAALRTGIEQAQLPGGKPVLLLGQLAVKHP